METVLSLSPSRSRPRHNATLLIRYTHAKMAPTPPNPWSLGIPATIAGTNANATITYEHGQYIVHTDDASRKHDAHEEIDIVLLLITLFGSFFVGLLLYDLIIRIKSCRAKTSKKYHAQSSTANNGPAADGTEPDRSPGTDSKEESE